MLFKPDYPTGMPPDLTRFLAGRPAYMKAMASRAAKKKKRKRALVVGKTLPPNRNRREESILDSTQAKLSSLRYGSDSEGRGPGMRLCQRMQ